jgi:hypothetical protein
MSTQHKPPVFTRTYSLNDAGQLLSDSVTDLFQQLAVTLASTLPDGRKLAIVMTKIEEANLWAQATIASSPDFHEG